MDWNLENEWKLQVVMLKRNCHPEPNWAEHVRLNRVTELTEINNTNFCSTRGIIMQSPHLLFRLGIGTVRCGCVVYCRNEDREKKYQLNGLHNILFFSLLFPHEIGSVYRTSVFSFAGSNHPNLIDHWLILCRWVVAVNVNGNKTSAGQNQTLALFKHIVIAWSKWYILFCVISCTCIYLFGLFIHFCFFSLKDQIKK